MMDCGLSISARVGNKRSDLAIVAACDRMFPFTANKPGVRPKKLRGGETSKPPRRFPPLAPRTEPAT